MKRLEALLTGILMVTMGSGPASAASVTEGSNISSQDYGKAQVDSDYQLKHNQGRKTTTVYPAGTTSAARGGDTVSIATTDVCTNAAGGCPILCPDGKICSSQLPPPTTVTSSSTATGGGTSAVLHSDYGIKFEYATIDTWSQTITATGTGTGTYTSTASATSTHVATSAPVEASVTVIDVSTLSVGPGLSVQETLGTATAMSTSARVGMNPEILAPGLIPWTADGQPGGVCPLDGGSQVPISYIPIGTGTDTGHVVGTSDPRMSDPRSPTGNISVGPGLAVGPASGTATATTTSLASGPKITAPGLMTTASATNFMAATVTHFSGDIPTASATAFLPATTTHLSGDIGTSSISGSNVTVDVSGGAITGTHPVASTYTLPVAGTTTTTGTNTATLGGVKAGPGLTRAPDGTLSSGALQPNSITCVAGSNNFTAINGQVTACSVTSYLTPNSINSACTKPTFTGGQATTCGSATYSDVGADAAGAAAARAAPGTCSGGQFVSATTTSGVTCATPAGSGNVSTTGLTINRLAKAGSSTALVDSHVTDDGTTVTVGGFSSEVFKWSNGTISALMGELSDVGGWVGLALNSNSLAVAQVALYANLTTGTVVNAPSGKTVFFNFANTNYASVSSAGIAASNITATPGASKIVMSDANSTVDSWVTGSTQKAAYTWTDGNVSTSGGLGYWRNLVSHTITLAGGSSLRIHVEAIFADGYAAAHTCGVSIMADHGSTASTLRSQGGWLNGAATSSGLGAVVSGAYLNGSASTDAQVILAAGTTTVAIALFAAAGGYDCVVPTNLMTTIVQVF
jgi:hypothetical protein